MNRLRKTCINFLPSRELRRKCTQSNKIRASLWRECCVYNPGNHKASCGKSINSATNSIEQAM